MDDVVSLFLPMAHGEKIPCLTVRFDSPAPQFVRIDEQRDYFRAKADEFVAALLGSAPGGLVDQILGALLLRKASDFRVPL